jgi:hypothetical protein
VQKLISERRKRRRFSAWEKGNLCPILEAIRSEGPWNDRRDAQKPWTDIWRERERERARARAREWESESEQRQKTLSAEAVQMCVCWNLDRRGRRSGGHLQRTRDRVASCQTRRTNGAQPTLDWFHKERLDFCPSDTRFARTLTHLSVSLWVRMMMLNQYLPEQLGENHEKIEDRLCPGRSWNRAPRQVQVESVVAVLTCSIQRMSSSGGCGAV